MLQTLLSLVTSHTAKFVPLLIFTKQFSPHPQPIRAQQSLNCNTSFAPLLYRQCRPTWISNNAIITMETILEHAQNGTLIVVSVSQIFPLLRLPMLGPLWQLVPVSSAHCLPVPYRSRTALLQRRTWKRGPNFWQREIQTVTSNTRDLSKFECKVRDINQHRMKLKIVNLQKLLELRFYNSLMTDF